MRPRYSNRKQNETNYKIWFPINLVLKNNIKNNSSQLRLICKISNPSYEMKITSKKIN
jgi:hypothetical protein